MEKNSNISSLQNALRILNSFSVYETEKRVTGIAKELDLPKSTVSRLLQTLLQEGYVKKNTENGKYSLGIKIFSLYGSLMANMQVVKESHPILEALAKETSESIQLAQRENSYVVYTDQVKSNYPMQIYSHIGLMNPIHCTSSGKVLLAYEDKSVVDEILNNELSSYTNSTITNSEILRAELKKIKEQGYCLTKNEFIDGIVAIAAPVWDYNNRVIAAVSLVGPVQRINGAKVNSYIIKVQKAAQKISSNMGFEHRQNVHIK